MQEDRHHFDTTSIPPEWTTDLRRIARISPHTAGWGGEDILPSEKMRVYVGTLVFAALFGGVVYFTPPPQASQEVAAVAEVPLPAPVDPAPFFAELALEADAAYVYDAAKGKVLFEKNAEAQLPLASLTKVMTALVASERLQSGPLTILEAALAPEGDGGLPVGGTIARDALINATLVASINDGAAALALSDPAGREGFIAAMNEKAASLALAQTYFLNETGLDENLNVSGGYGSARDVANLMAHIVTTHPMLLAATTKDRFSAATIEGIPIEAANTNKFLHDVPFISASKTGFTDLAGGNLAISFDLDFGRPIVVVVLGSTESGRFSDASALASAARRALSQ